MENPVSWEKTRSIAILRTLDKTYYDVANILNISGSTISSAENWLIRAPFDEVKAVFTVDKLQKVVNEVLTDKDIHPTELVSAARLTPDDILEHYRKDYPKHEKKTLEPFGAVESTLHQEHHVVILKLVERLITDLKPDLSAPYIRRLIDSKKGKGDVQVDYVLKPDENTEVQIVRGYLEQHFNSSPYRWVMNDKDRGMIKWTRIVNDELNRRIKLLRSIDREATRKTGFTINNPNSTGYIGLSYWFSDSIFDSVLENLYCNLDYKVEAIENRLFGLRYGAAFIAQTEREEEIPEYEDSHKQLMARYEKSKTVKAIKRRKKERNTTAKETTDVLHRLLVDKHVPGKCDYEFCG